MLKHALTISAATAAGNFVAVLDRGSSGTGCKGVRILLPAVGFRPWRQTEDCQAYKESSFGLNRIVL